ncbi:acetylornithine/succinylornithine family transaminase [Anaerovorax odorimutans]|uniref:Acetylornithine aminotransferase n=1 Tax=Anaerovorax odorimutans TaxID=109327 RepID=A0ABT1RJ02_9FIRM|nr:acetylornithine/succinylornithine family transaminase [Anaerovorax odorimutans]MCQ4635154.1 acetylornithine/succinylornithine family transaminase [Anaerovorax odorimutans]
MKKIDIKKADQEKIVGTYARYDLVADSGKGAVCVDEKGKEYIDFTAGIGVNSLGFCDEGWVKAVTKQLKKLQHVSNLFYTEPQARVAELLTARTGLSKVFFSNSGAEANEVAIKAARKYSNNKYGNDINWITTLENSFHGRTMAAITATGQESYHKDFYPFLGNFSYCKPNDLEDLQKNVTDKTCAIMLEIIQGEGGVVNLKKEFLQEVEELCRRKDMVFIVDEVQTGIGRTGTLFAYEQFGIKPDIVTFAKGIGGGLPIGGALFGEKVCDVLGPGNHGTTYGGNPVACAGALEVLTRMDEAFLKEVAEKGEYMKKKLLSMPSVVSVSGMGLMIGVEIEGKEAKAVVAAALENGLMSLTAKDKIRLLPPLTITYEEIDKGLKILEDVLK